MHVLVNGIRLYFDVEGAGLRPAGERMIEKPTLVLLHGGPGADHSLYKPAFSALTDVAQVVYLDHRGNGRSERGPKEAWTLAQWADDVRAFCEALGIVKPVVYGASFGGMVAMTYAVRHPGHAGKLVLVSTAAQAAAHAQAKVAMFGRLGGDAAGDLARRRFIDGDTGPDVLKAWLQVALPLYTQTPLDPASVARIAMSPEATAWFNRPGGEGRTFDMLRDLARIECPTLVLGGTLDPMLPIECQRDIAAAIRKDLLQYREFERCGHGVFPDVPDEAVPLLKAFIQDGRHATNIGVRQAVREDIAGMHRVRLAVRENRLTSSAIREEHYIPEIEVTGRGWVVTEGGAVVAFAVGNRDTQNIWALFVDPAHERKGYGRRLHDVMVEWLFSQGVERIWLSTDPATRAQRFYEAAGWTFRRILPDGEHYYELQRKGA